jgi:hypothetical protein
MRKTTLAACLLALAAALPTAASATPAPSALFLFDGATMPTSVFSLGGSAQLTLRTGASTTGPRHKSCSAEQPPCHSLLLDGDEDYADGRDASFTAAPDGDFSVSAWARSTGWGFSWQPLVFMDDDTYNTYSWAIYGTTNDSGTVHAYVRMRDGATLDTLDLYDTPRNTLSDGTWHHVALSVDGNQASLYFDGALADTQTSSLAAGTVDVADDHLFVGGDTYYESEKFDGDIDDLSLFDQAIDAPDVADLATT